MNKRQLFEDQDQIKTVGDQKKLPNKEQPTVGRKEGFQNQKRRESLRETGESLEKGRGKKASAAGPVDDSSDNPTP